MMSKRNKFQTFKSNYSATCIKIVKDVEVTKVWSSFQVKLLRPVSLFTLWIWLQLAFLVDIYCTSVNEMNKEYQ